MRTGNGDPVDLGQAGRVDERRRPRLQGSPDQRSAVGLPPRVLGNEAGSRGGRPGGHARIERHERGADHRARRRADEIDPRGIDIRDAVGVDVHPDLNHADELHEVGNRLPVRVA